MLIDTPASGSFSVTPREQLAVAGKDERQVVLVGSHITVEEKTPQEDSFPSSGASSLRPPFLPWLPAIPTPKKQPLLIAWSRRTMRKKPFFSVAQLGARLARCGL